MALIACRECGVEVSDQAKVCPHCGAAVKSSGGCLRVVLLSCVLLLLAGWLSYQAKKPTVVTSSASVAPSDSKVGLIKDDWSYSQSDDSLSGKTIYYARVLSSNFVNFGRPYDGVQFASLVARTHPRWGRDLYLSLQRGQILCRSYNPCAVDVVFDGGKVLRYEGTAPESGDTTMVFISPYSSFMGKVLKSKEVRISIPVYKEGRPTFVFNVDGFSVDEYRPK